MKTNYLIKSILNFLKSTDAQTTANGILKNANAAFKREIAVLETEILTEETNLEEANINLEKTLINRGISTGFNHACYISNISEAQSEINTIQNTIKDLNKRKTYFESLQIRINSEV